MKGTGLAATAVFVLVFTLIASGQVIQSPEEFFGHKLGADGKLARWDKIVEYFKHLDAASDRIVVRELGKSTEGNPFILAIISSAENLEAMDRYKEINRKLADPRGLSAEEIEGLIAAGRYTLAVTNSLHATEVGGTQMSPQLAWELVTGDTPLVGAIRENCILLLFPCFNPDGQLMVIDWFNKTEGTEYEGARLPYLYHKYTGHDNNRDGYMLTQAESKLLSNILYKEWFPHAYIDHHHMGSYGARLYIPPYFDPIHPNIDGLTWREHLLYGALMAERLELAGKTGIETGAPYTAWWMASFHMITNYHNITGMLTESASAAIADPVFIHPHQLQPSWRGRPEYKAQVNFPSPWPGGWWRLGDIVEQIKVSTYAALELGAMNRELLLRSACLKAKRQIELGESQAPYAYIVPSDAQHDYLTALKMLDTLMRAGVEVHRASRDIAIGNAVYPAGSYVILLRQPLRAYVKSLLERIHYPDNDWTRTRDGSPMRPYDMAAFTLAEHMGVKAVEADVRIAAPLEKADKLDWPEGKLDGPGDNGYLLDPRLNDSAVAVNRVFKAGGQVWRLMKPVEAGVVRMPAGAFVVKAEVAELRKIASDLHLELLRMPMKIGEAPAAAELEAPRLGMYHRYQGGNMDEGWTRWLLEQFEFPCKAVLSDEIKKGNLIESYDVLILPSDRLEALVGPDYEKLGPDDVPTPPEYRSGLGEEGIAKLKEFVAAGGTLVALNSAAELPIKKFELSIMDVIENVDGKRFFCPGSTLRVDFDAAHPIALGMPERGLILNWSSPTFAVNPNPRNSSYTVIAAYPAEGDLLESGWLIGEDILRGRAAAVMVELGKGRIVLLGMRPQHRAQTHGTFKLLFNAIYIGGM